MFSNYLIKNKKCFYEEVSIFKQIYYLIKWRNLSVVLVFICIGAVGYVKNKAFGLLLCYTSFVFIYHLFISKLCIPLFYRVKIFINKKPQSDISFSQRSFLKMAPENTYLITFSGYKEDYFKQTENLCVLYVYFDFINYFLQREDEYRKYFILKTLFYIVGFFILFMAILFFIKEWKSLHIPNLIIFTSSIAFMILYSFLTIRDYAFDTQYFSNIFENIQEIKDKDIGIKLFEKYFLVDKTMDEREIPLKIQLANKYEEIQQEEIKNRVFEWTMQIIIAIFLAVSVPIFYANIYPNDSRIVESIPLEVKNGKQR